MKMSAGASGNGKIWCLSVSVRSAFLRTDLDLDPVAILGSFVFRWRIETTFQEVREHLGVETQRQWSDLAILRTTPALLGLYSLVAIWRMG